MEHIIYITLYITVANIIISVINSIKLSQIENQNEMTNEELKTKLSDIGAQLNKAKDEIIAALAAAGVVDPAIEAAVNQIGNTAQALDDLNPDAPTP